MTIDTERIEAVGNAYLTATESWAGLDWCEIRPPEGGLPGTSAYDINGIDTEDPEVARDWMHSLLSDCPDLAESEARDRVELALREAKKYQEKVASDAEAAEHKAESAMDALKVGDIERAKSLAKEARDIENEYGDAPTWGAFHKAMQEVA